jgi:hypothetical protein
MGYAFCTSACFGCRRIFSYNPVRVPSIRDLNNVRQPICQECVNRANPQRIINGLDPIVVFPDAYDCCDEGELP